jgi:FlaA1/EpsC-like NDP-sugar epimerase
LSPRARKSVRYLALIAFDLAATAVSLHVAMLIRFEEHVPASAHALAVAALPFLLLCRLTPLLLTGMHRWAFFLSGIEEAVRLNVAVTAGTLLFVGVWFGLMGQSLPISVLALEGFITLAILSFVRFSPRFVVNLLSERQDHGQQRTLIVGAGSAGDLLLRDIRRSPERNLRVMGFIDDDPQKRDTTLGGRPVLGTIEELPRFIEEQKASLVLLAVVDFPAEKVRRILDLCSTHKTRFKIIPASFTHADERLSAAILHDLAPEDLLPRRAASFDPAEVASLVNGKRILVTGAAGSIGSEIVRQAAAHGATKLVLVDVNENGLYFLARQLQATYPALRVRAEVADVREPERILRLGRRYQPQIVFHAAAHKHVPLMEDAPEEAVKNNVFGTLNVARMADAIGAERFVLISTDKAVRPSSVMGASKRIAELVVRDLRRRSTTQMTAVRFGNVLGSAGSVVPLFKEQIARGGPVTVTHPDCTRYFMTIPEAVGLVLVTAAGDYGDLCVLEMGEPVRIVDMANHLITMAGYVPGLEIPVVFTGLRPGEKLHETLMTEDEERTCEVRDGILSAASPLPPADFLFRLDELRRWAEAGDVENVMRLIRVLVPTYCSGNEQIEPELVATQPKEITGEFVILPSRAAFPVKAANA